MSDEEHTCAISFKNSFVNSKMMAEKYVNQFRANPAWNYEGMNQQLRTDTNVDASLWQYYRARRKAKVMIEGTIKEQYSKLWEYCGELKRMNPGSSVKMQCEMVPGDENPHFKRLYVCLEALKCGWKAGYRPIVGLDGCFIKGHHTGQLLTAVGVDPYNQMYPIAYALVESECGETWRWFLELLGQDLGINNSHGISWVTDKQKGLIDAIAELFPESEHRHCVKHLHNNFKVQHKGLMLKQLIWVAAKSTTSQGGENQAAYQWLAEKDPRNWTRAHMKEFPKCDMLCNNMCEAFNSAIVQARDKPVITLMEMVRNYLMSMMAKKREELKKWNHPIGPKVMRYLEKVKLASSCCNPKFCGGKSYQVRCFDNEQYVMDLEIHTCAYRKWQLIGIPCMHAFLCINLMNMDVYDFIHPFYKKEAYLEAYSPIIHGINGPNMWAKTKNRPLQCPQFKKQRGKPKKARKLQSDEVCSGGEQG
ncbi:hypothetical protein UlMin_018369 [Ulmus minor]